MLQPEDSQDFTAILRLSGEANLTRQAFETAMEYGIKVAFSHIIQLHLRKQSCCRMLPGSITCKLRNVSSGGMVTGLSNPTQIKHKNLNQTS